MTENDKTVRDEFAMHALTAFMNWSLNQPPVGDNDSAVKAAKRYAMAAYDIADAMMEARKK